MLKRISELLMLLVLFSALFASGVFADSSKTYDDFTTRDLVFGEVLRKGVDVSAYNGKIDWQAAADSGVEFAFIRVAGRYSSDTASETFYTDSYYKINITGAQAAGIKVGAYFFSQATTEDEAREEVQYAASLLQGYSLDLPLVMDFEYITNRKGQLDGRLYKAKLTAKQATAVCNAFFDEAALNGFSGMVYASLSTLRDQMNVQDLTGEVWLAHWTSSTSYSGAYKVWQCSSSGSVDGITGAVDLDFLYDDSLISGWYLYQGSYYYIQDGSKATGWQNIDGKYYLFSSGGIMQTGLQTVDGKLYDLGSDGAMLTGWQTMNEDRYYFLESGEAATGSQTIDGQEYLFDENGILQIGLQIVDGKLYARDENGILQTGWQTVNDRQYYFLPSGEGATGWQQIDGAWYYFGDDCGMTTGWQKIEGHWYYLSAQGDMQTGWQQIDGSWYYLNRNGSMKTGWMKSGGKWYYFGSSGAMKTGWMKWNGSWYYLGLSGDGAMKTGWIKWNSSWYYLGTPDGAMKTGWMKWNGSWYYLDSAHDGAMTVNGSIVYQNIEYFFNAGGVCTNP